MEKLDYILVTELRRNGEVLWKKPYAVASATKMGKEQVQELMNETASSLSDYIARENENRE